MPANLVREGSENGSWLSVSGFSDRGTDSDLSSVVFDIRGVEAGKLGKIQEAPDFVDSKIHEGRFTGAADRPEECSQGPDFGLTKARQCLAVAPRESDDEELPCIRQPYGRVDPESMELFVV